MQKRSSTQTAKAKRLMEGLESGDELSADLRHLMAVSLGRRGGKKGGKARAKKLSAERRSEIASKAAEVRWKNAAK